jgi:hypothetical protein
MEGQSSVRLLRSVLRLRCGIDFRSMVGAMRVPVEQITRDRFVKWEKRFTHSHATPFLAMGMGHDENLGQVVLVTVDEKELDLERLREFLRFALRRLEAVE